jgi:hypothetical protein
MTMLRALIRATSLLTLSTVLASNSYAAQSNDFFQIITPQAKSELWINPGLVSRHFQQDKGLNNGNLGGWSRVSL